MRKPVILITLILSFVAFSLEAQRADEVGCLSAGIKAGITYGTPVGKKEAEATGKLGLGPVVGFYGRYGFTEKVGLQAELYYIQKKAKFYSPVYDQIYSYPYHPSSNPDTTVYIETIFNGSVTGEFNNHYFEVPILGYCNLGDRYSLLFGPYVGYMMSGKNIGTATGNVGVGLAPLENEPFDESVNLSKWDVGVAGGVRYDTKSGFNCELRATGGFRSVYSPSYTLREEPVVNFYLQLTAGYKIHSFCKKEGEKEI